MADRSTLHDDEIAFIRSQRVARLATSDGDGHPHVVPVCFAFDGSRFYTPLDEKPKRVEQQRLRRVRNIEARHEAMLLFDEYHEDWSRLGYMQVYGHAGLLMPGEPGHKEALLLLRQRYVQYRSMALEEHPLIVITPRRVVAWGATRKGSTMDFSHFDTRNYPTISAQEGYGAWASTYEGSVLDLMDLRLLERIKSVTWDHIDEAADLACGTGRTGVWLKQKGVASLDGVDFTPEMLEGARAKGVYRQLLMGDIRETPLHAGAYDLVTVDLADEHLSDVQPLYQEAARIARPNGYLVLVGYHPFFLMSGIPTHFNSASGEPVAIESHIHLISDHVQAALAAGWSLLEMHEGLIDDEWLERKPKWNQYRNRPISFAMVWQKQRND